MPFWVYVILTAFAVICTGIYAAIAPKKANKLTGTIIAAIVLFGGYWWSFNHLNLFEPPTTAFLDFRPASNAPNVETIAERWLYGTTLANVPGTLSATKLPTGAYLIDWKVKGRDIKIALSRHYRHMQGANADGTALILAAQSGQYN